MKRARIIYNPTAGREEMKKQLADVLDYLERIGYETSAFATNGKGSATREAKRAVIRGYDLVIAAGGDGTVYEVINGMAEKENLPKLAILPMGTSNDFARSIGIPKDIKKALEIIKKDNTKFIDVGKMNKKYFINIAGGGTLTELTYEVPSKLKTVLGHMAYYIKGIEKITQFKPFDVQIETNGKSVTEEIMMFLVANSNTVGGFDKLAPMAKIDDGLLDVILLKKCNLADLARVMTLLAKGQHLKDPKIVHFQTKEMIIRTENNVQMNLDGELGGSMPSHFKILPKHIEMIINK